MSDYRNLQNLLKADKTFNRLSYIEKIICSCIANCNIELRLFQLGWLIRDLYKRGICEEELSDEQISDSLSNLLNKNILFENNEKFSISDSYFHSAYIFPLTLDTEKFSISLYSFANFSDFSFEVSYKQNIYSSILINILNGNFNTDIFSTFDFSFLNNNSNITSFNKLLEPFDESWFELLPEKSQIFLLNYAIYYELLNFDSILSNNGQSIFSYFMKPKWYKSDLFLLEGSHNLALYLIFKGNFDRAKSYIEISTSIEAKGITAFLVYLFHGSSDSLNIYRDGLKLLQKQKSKRNITFFSLAEIFYFISLLQDGSSDSLYEAKKYIEKLDKLNLIFRPVYPILYEFYLSKTIGKYNQDKINNFLKNQSNCCFSKWIGCFISFWIGYNDKSVFGPIIENLLSRSKKSEFNLLYSETFLLAKLLNLSLNLEEKESNENTVNYIIPFVDRIQQKQKWELLLDELSSTLNLSINNNDNTVRIIWNLKLNNDEAGLKLIPKEQQRLKNGEWSIGKPVLLDSYYEGINPFPEYYTNQDKAIYKSLQHSKFFVNTNTLLDFSILPLMINCPNVYLNENFDTPIEIIKGIPVLMLKENEEGLFFTFQPRFQNEKILAVLENDKRIRVYEFSDVQQQTAKILNENEIFPKSSLNKIKSIINSLSLLMPVHSSIEGTKNLTPIASVAASSQIYAQLDPIGNGLKVRFCIKPFGTEGPSFIPGKGDSDIFTEIAGQNLHTKRNLQLEQSHFNELLRNCPILLDNINEEGVCIYNTAESSLDLLLNLKNCKELIIEWPENVKPKKVISSSFSDFSFRIKSFNDWFTIDGDLKIDENHVLDLQKILKNYHKGSRFIEIDDNQFLAITEDFRSKLEDLQSFTQVDNNQNLFHKSSIQIIDDILSGNSHLTFDKSWHDMLNHIKHATEKTFNIPKEFKAELRAYQEEGFKWLSKMSYLGMGSCLADDMGLGKTVEALSIITARASLGPAFVLAPTSVCSNWFNECHRFAPTLNPILFAQSDRKDVINKLAPNDLIICSYGVLQREIENLAQIDWSTLVLDEAQAIKNMSTNRSQAAMLLKGKFKMLMTGTPIENHLGELWNLFRFLNPGLLGSINSFNEKFAVPIQSFNDKKAQERLKKLVKPFILRRTKNQVLKDLPPRTEVTLNVDLSQEEAELYESIRREAINNINKSGENKSDSKPMIVLAEIMKLRRLCCNPSLIMPNLNIKSSKLSLLENITEELLASGHKALIFSQFVDHLTIIRKFFDSKGYNYQYLDGSTTIRARNKAIKEFQDGNGDFFLISLKAGGQGINLTAADYVIHMDPWWNPAVEDQASDRAHRIGQTKPVTIYKLITTNTIEEKIVQLHGRKKDLADGLLEGTDIVGRISTQELISLINNSAMNN